jgi:hypothetical protein
VASRPVTGFSIVVSLALGLALGAGPVLGFSGVTETGTRGQWQVKDNAVPGEEGVRCFYENNGTGGSDLVRVRVRPPTLVKGAYANASWVGWRFRIMRSTDGGSTFQAYFTSTTWKDKASSSAAADAFGYRSWNVPGGLDQSSIRVQLTIFFYRPGSSTTVAGKVVGLYDNYINKYEGYPLGSGTASSCYTLEA